MSSRLALVPGAVSRGRLPRDARREIRAGPPLRCEGAGPFYAKNVTATVGTLQLSLRRPFHSFVLAPLQPISSDNSHQASNGEAQARPHCMNIRDKDGIWAGFHPLRRGTKIVVAELVSGCFVAY